MARAHSHSRRIPPALLTLLILAASLTLALTWLPPSTRHFLRAGLCDAIGWLRKAGLTRVGALLFAVWNFKVLPGVYHVRIALAILPSLLQKNHLHAPPKASQQQLAGASVSSSSPDLPLFAPHILSTFSPPLEHDSNLHKSNSTYFSDLDISRSALLARLFLPTLRHAAKRSGSGGLGVKLTVALGGAQADFKRGIGLQRYAVVSRIVGWDRKWVVVGSWFVGPRHQRSSTEEKRTVYASALAKYVFKAGRATIRPIIIMVAAGLLPLAALDGLDGEKGQAAQQVLSAKEAEIVDALRTIRSKGPRKLDIVDQAQDGEEQYDDDKWMSRVEDVRQEGRAMTEHFLALDAVANLV
ncbi:uncharacterized protein J3D65DRAFT_616633 [Phyllosticta citribraziliensis]|uniref:Uncharacterized protein n=1 Tax=Phyllosticta citribraziliensis TaxID=989973 RepID=A0ABR1M1L3_9PEZI